MKFKAAFVPEARIHSVRIIQRFVRVFYAPLLRQDKINELLAQPADGAPTLELEFSHVRTLLLQGRPAALLMLAPVCRLGLKPGPFMMFRRFGQVWLDMLPSPVSGCRDDVHL